jgi:hypothetical protein
VDLRAKGSRLWMLMIVGGVLLAGGALALFAFKGKGAETENARKAGAAAGDGIEAADGTMGMGEAQNIIMQGMREDVARKPCDKALNYKLAVALIEEGAYEDAGDVSDKYAKNCPEPFVRLLRKGYYAHEQAERWANAEETAGRLIAAEPAEGSFWWWRGQVRVKQNELVPAAADLRQAMAGTPFARSRGYSVRDFAQIADKVGAVCDAAAALQAYADANGGDVAISFVDLQSKLHLAGGCEKVYGTGSFANPANPAIDKIEVKVGKTKGSFVLGLTTGYTVLSRAFAARAGVTAAGDPHQTYAAGSLLSGQPGVAPTISFGGGSAPDIQVLVVDALPGEIDGVLGRSFLHRFRYQEPGADDDEIYDDE